MEGNVMKVLLCIVAALLVAGVVHLALAPLVHEVSSALSNAVILNQSANGKLSIGDQH